MNNIPCDVVKDLLPSYIDGLTSEVTNAVIKEHLSECEECRKAYERMREPEKAFNNDDAKEVDFLKKQKKKAGKSVVLGIAATVAVLILCVFLKTFVIGSVCNPNVLAYDIEVTGENVTFTGFLTDSAGRVNGVSFKEKDGKIDITVKEAFILFSGSGECKERYTASGTVSEVYLNGKLIWQDGIKLSPEIARIYAMKNEYVGNASANVNLAVALGVQEYFGQFTNELHTSEEPYGWTLVSGNVLYDKSTEEVNAVLCKYGTVLLAMVDNLGYVEFKYTLENDTVTKNGSVTITTEEASNIIGGDIKASVKSVADLQRLVEKLGLYTRGVFGNSLSSYVNDNVVLKLKNSASDAIYSVDVSVITDGKTIFSEGTCNADGSELRKNEIITFSFTPEFYGFTLEGTTNTELIINICGKGNNVLKTFKIDIDFNDANCYDGNTYTRELVISGNAEEGYKLGK
ncbi:MAG: DUF4825 domain-containing protein [Lachnospiraceae bacterium]|nr:DUF4825 domain-containing protein [Lachnospiraceae bacterium]